MLGLAANTSFAGLPVLMSLLARDHRLPHLFYLRTERPVYRYGVVSLALLAGILLIAVNASTIRLIPLFTIGSSSDSPSVRPGWCGTGWPPGRRAGSGGSRSTEPVRS